MTEQDRRAFVDIWQARTLAEAFEWYQARIVPHMHLAVRRGELGYRDCDELDEVLDIIRAKIAATAAPQT